MKRFLSLLLAVALALPTAVRADEGMWLPLLMQKLNYQDMRKAGLKLSAKDLYDVNHGSLKDAIVSFGGFCTGEVISSQGLLLTNHHCGFDAIQTHSTVEHNYLDDGFWAMNKEQELPNPGLYAAFLVRMEDVSAQINAQLTAGMSEDERRAVIAKAASELTKKATEGTTYNASVESFYHGNQFYLFVYNTFNDVRLVGAPPSSVGKFGGDTDNWMWPRHTGDFSMFRVYMNADGTPSKGFDPANVPLKPKHHLPVSLRGVEDGDFTMVFGYPGRTNRYLSSWGVQQAIDKYNPTVVTIRDAKLKTMKKYMNADKKVEIMLSANYAQTANYWKYFIGQTEQLKNNKVFDKKAALENRFRTWVAQDPARQAKYGNTLQLLAESYLESDPTVVGDVYVNEAGLRGPAAPMLALTAYRRLAMLKKDASAEDVAKLATSLKEGGAGFFAEFNAASDQEMMAILWEMWAKNVPADQLPSFLTKVNAEHGSFANFAAKVYSSSAFTDAARYEAWATNPTMASVEGDLLGQAMKQIWDIRTGGAKARKATADKKALAYRQWSAAVREMMPEKKWAPDANSTMRMTYGKVGSYQPKDGVTFKHYTTLEGVMQKMDNSNPEFEVPAKLKALYDAKDYGIYANAEGQLPVGFISNNDITGGNSGSPVINARGELIGTAFDGNWEAMSGDIFFETQLQRTISCDIRYVLFIIDKYAGAGHLVQEMTLVK
jgi:uncharacterized protein YbaA (DUF1428 family)